jgi:hypothetical protein
LWKYRKPLIEEDDSLESTCGGASSKVHFWQHLYGEASMRRSISSEISDKISTSTSSSVPGRAVTLDKQQIAAVRVARRVPEVAKTDVL